MIIGDLTQEVEVEDPPEGDIEETKLQRKKGADFSELTESTERMRNRARMLTNQSCKGLLPDKAVPEEEAQSEMKEEVDQEEILEKDIE